MAAGDGSTGQWGWFDCVGELIAAGHGPCIGRYTLRQIREYLAAEERRQRREREWLALIVRAAQATDEGFATVLADIRGR